MFRRSAFVLLLLVAALGMSCDSGTGSTSTTQLIGNDTCSTVGAVAYDPSPPKTNGTAVGQAIQEMPHTHIDPPKTVRYEHDPPTSGCHYNLGAGTAPIQAGVYDKSIPAEYWVHNLEHGWIIALYNCPTDTSTNKPNCPAEFNALVNWYKTLSPDAGCGFPKVAVVQWTSMEPKFAMVSWDWYDPMQTKLDITEVGKYFDNHKGNAPEPAC